ncbi:CPBP family intramembrane metalloprotease [Sphingomonas limnosediminicola]|jgi:membrane protease YdiL (CAAX protease family)|uniref:CPBP family intramembrane metalloprotease n=1 Tax=Sphingomonas limnosediminicola TaxID=940133 RepID=A0ABP7L3U4_9SPHN
MSYTNRDGGRRRLIDHPFVSMVVAILLFAAASALAIIAASSLPLLQDGLKQAVQVVITVGFGLAAYKLGIRHLGEEPRDDLQLNKALSQAAIGLIAGLALFSAVVGVAALLGSYRIVSCCSTTNLLPELFVAAIMPGFMEELFFRGILFRWLEEMGGSWIALFVTSALFGLAHAWNPNSNVLASIFIAVEAGVLLGGAYMLTRSLWMPIGLHAAWNFTQGYLFGVPVSGVAEKGLVGAKLSGPELLTGGPFGLEASAIALVLATGAGVVMVIKAFRCGRSVPPPWRAPIT